MVARFRQRLIAGETLVGTIVSVESPEIVEVLCHIGFDWLFIETEHSPLSPVSVQRIIQIAGDTPCVVRLPGGDEVSIKRALDAGAAGIIVPQVNSAPEAQRVVSYSKYAPLGSRGVGLTRASKFGLDFDDYLVRANENTAVIVQAEHIDAVANIDEISDVPGIDAVFIGPYDLSASLNKVGLLQDPEVTDAIWQVNNTCLDKGLNTGIYGRSPEMLTQYREAGCTLLCCGVDIAVLADAARRILDNLRNG